MKAALSLFFFGCLNYLCLLPYGLCVSRTPEDTRRCPPSPPPPPPAPPFAGTLLLHCLHHQLTRLKRAVWREVVCATALPHPPALPHLPSPHLPLPHAHDAKAASACRVGGAITQPNPLDRFVIKIEPA